MSKGKDMINYESAKRNLKAAGYRKTNEVPGMGLAHLEDWSKGNRPIISLRINGDGVIEKVEVTRRVWDSVKGVYTAEVEIVNGLKELKDMLNR